MASVLTIWRQALIHVGSRATVQSETEATREAQTLNNIWQSTYEAELEAFDWDFLTTYRTLSLLSEDAPTLWDYAYQWPSDCLSFRYIVASTRADDDPIAYEIGIGTGGSKVIWTDEEDAEACYSKKVTDVSFWSADFRDALAWKLASALAMTEIGSPADSERLEAIATVRMDRAAVLSANTHQRDPIRDSEGIRERE